MTQTLGRRATDHSLQREIEHEQAVVDRIYARLDAAARAAREIAADGFARSGLNETGLVERDAFVYQVGLRLASLDAAHDGLVFGRLDLRDGEARYIGRLGLRDEHRDVILVDWRAPAAALFYQATAEEPSGVVRRRVISSFSSRIVGLEDDLLDPEAMPADMVVIGDGALMAELGRSRGRSMRSVVATIQKEQDAAIRSPHRGVTMITGGPGTGKTVVALHRAAYLLYTDRRRYESGGVLVVGPSAVFMGYISRVLPSLGETTVSLRSLGEVVDGVDAIRHDLPAAAVVKGSVRMARVLARAARRQPPGVPTSFRMFYRDEVLELDAAALGRIRRVLLAGGQRPNRAVGRVVPEIVSALWSQASGTRAVERGSDAFERTMRSDRGFLEFVASWWPPVDAVEALGWLADRERLAACAQGLLSTAEAGAVADSLAAGVAAGKPAVEDVPLIDELRHLLGEAPESFEDDEFDPVAALADELVPELTAGADRSPSAAARPTRSIEDDDYAHILVDEAQDLSPMQWRMLGRRGRAASWTIVGDSAQRSWPLPAEADAARDEALRGRARNAFRLSTNYRNSKEIFDLASDYTRASVPDADLPNAVRETGVAPVLVLAAPDGVAARVASQVARLAAELDGTIGVAVAPGREGEVAGWLEPGDPQLFNPELFDPERIRVLAAVDTKGLEFDGMVVVEPDQIVSAGPTGARSLYVVLTRATQRLVVIGSTGRWHTGR